MSKASKRKARSAWYAARAKAVKGIMPAIREANGRAQRPTRKQLEEADAKARNSEKNHAFQQPHRRGARDPQSTWVDLPWGAFCDAHRLRSEVYDAGWSYSMLMRSVRLAKTLPCPFGNVPGVGEHDPEETKDLSKLEAKIKAADRAMQDASWFGTNGMWDMCKFNEPTTEPSRGIIKAALALAIHFGKLDAKFHPFQ